MSTLKTIISKLETDVKFYKLATTDLSKAVSSYKLSRTELLDLKSKFGSIKPPKGYDDPIIAKDGFEDPFFRPKR